MRRLLLLVIAVLVIAAGLAVHTWAPGELGGFAGDALYAVLVFLLIALVVPALPGWVVAAAAVAVCWGIELLQLTPIPVALSRSVPGAALVLGSTFQASDLIAYALGVAAAAAADAVIRRAAGSSRGGRTTPSGGAPGRRLPEGTPSPPPGAAGPGRAAARPVPPPRR